MIPVKFNLRPAGGSMASRRYTLDFTTYLGIWTMPPAGMGVGSGDIVSTGRSNIPASAMTRSLAALTSVRTRSDRNDFDAGRAGADSAGGAGSAKIGGRAPTCPARVGP